MLFNVASSFAGAPQGLSTSNKTILAGLAQAASLRRGRVVEFHLGPVSDPGSTDCNIFYDIQRQTANDGTGSAVTPVYFEALEAGGAPAVGSTWKANYTVEPTYANSLWSIALNQHSGFVWYAPDEIGVPWPAVNLNGLAFLAKGATASYSGSVHWDVKFCE